MATLVADVDAEIEAVIAALVSSGLCWRNPLTDQIVVWSAAGDRLVTQSEAHALQCWHGGATLQLWKNESEDLILGHADVGVRLYFDGCTAFDVATCLSVLISQQLAYRVLPE
ncbi:hypothetical protein LVB77_03520 [Lysobacter sp. 5GHs7-4]|uniref:hypothetical protein n=1 Tax=Lysobacter sp. 5GHs7-4 TaxID=2904253 RepID=UPI001E2E5BBE|nr:hypothetical protein [Lysobacter sp. 5GHs7-4]UHQ23793.1 hypothetical protein LVB77_03520 [Lysobacter sp. 5GHs7-4]